MAVLRLEPKTVFADDYEIVGSLAEGGMGSVYVARQLSTGKERALKIMQPGMTADERTRERFAREARAGSRIDSEHVVEVVGAGVDAKTDIPWLAMELLRGEDLAGFVKRIGPLAPPQALDILRQLCHGLAAAHAVGLVHRDLKPENVFLATARRVGIPYTVKLLDFGIAKIVEATSHVATDAVGTPTWMAPEQTEAGQPVKPAADVWSLGLIAFLLLTGRIYWRAANRSEASAMAILREVVFEPLEPASVRAKALGYTGRLPSGFDAWFARCLKREPSHRFANATVALQALEPVLAASDAVQQSSPNLEETVPPTERADGYFARPIPLSMATADMPPARIGAHPQIATVTGIEAYDEVDNYEKKLTGGRRWAAWATALLVVVVIGGGAWHFGQRSVVQPRFSGQETEPNDRAPQANSVPFAKTVRGQIGRRLDESRSDRDFYKVTVPPGVPLTRLSYRALPNIAPCLFLYEATVDDPFARFCAGRPGRDLTVPALRLGPGEYFITVLQDREEYGEAPAPPVLENVSDTYELTLERAEPPGNAEIEPNDDRRQAMALGPGVRLEGSLSWMRDKDVFCSKAGTELVRFVVEESLEPRPSGSVLEVTPLGGPNDGIPVRVHGRSATGEVTERDVKSPWTGADLEPSSEQEPPCVSVTLVPDVWVEPPLPRVAPASDHRYVVHLETRQKAE